MHAVESSPSGLVDALVSEEELYGSESSVVVCRHIVSSVIRKSKKTATESAKSSYFQEVSVRRVVFFSVLDWIQRAGSIPGGKEVQRDRKKRSWYSLDTI